MPYQDKTKQREYQRKWYSLNRNKLTTVDILEKRKKQKEYRIKNKEKIKEYRITYRIKNKEKIKEYQKNWNKKNRDQIQKRVNKYLKNNDVARTIKQIRERIRKVINGTNKSHSTIELLGANKEFVHKYLQHTFNINYPNLNINECDTHIDHIKPISSYDMNCDRQQKECFHYSNLQILLAVDNLKKSNKI